LLTRVENQLNFTFIMEWPARCTLSRYDVAGVGLSTTFDRLGAPFMNPNRMTPLAILCGLLLPLAVQAQGVKHGAGQLVVDVVTLKNGKTVRGAVIARADNDQAITMAVSRSLLQQSNPDLYKKALTDEANVQAKVMDQLRDRLKIEIDAARDQPRLLFFLKQELERVETKVAKKGGADPWQFVWLEVPLDQVSRVTRAAADRQRLAMWAWSDSLENVEFREAHDLERELKQRKIDPTTPAPDISERLPPRLQDDREWAARMAIVEYTLNKPLDFQGTGDLVVRADGEKKAIDLAPVFSKVLQSQLDSLLKDLTGDGPRIAAPVNDMGWLKTASKEADAIAARGLRSTRVEVKVDGSQAIVHAAFAARMPNGTWERVWSSQEIQDATKARPDVEARIAADPQVKQVLEAVNSFGIGADDQVRQAVRFGAATMSAQQAADARFFEFRDRYTRRLDGPPLVWSK
jgi:hypothetical protein